MIFWAMIWVKQAPRIKYLNSSAAWPGADKLLNYRHTRLVIYIHRPSFVLSDSMPHEKSLIYCCSDKPSTPYTRAVTMTEAAGHARHISS
jgi:hypothetical protein